MKTKLKPCNGDCNGELKSIWKREGKLLYCKSCWSKIMSGEKVVPIQKKQKPIAKHSDKRKKQEVAYQILRKVYLNTHCSCEAKISKNCKKFSDQIHHKSGRIANLLCDDTKFLAVCSPCHIWIENNRIESIELGFSELRTNK